jgi:hypothetical protein
MRQGIGDESYPENLVLGVVDQHLLLTFDVSNDGTVSRYKQHSSWYVKVR